MKIGLAGGWPSVLIVFRMCWVQRSTNSSKDGNRYPPTQLLVVQPERNRFVADVGDGTLTAINVAAKQMQFASGSSYRTSES